MNNWSNYTERYERGEWRTPIFRDMILEDVRHFRRPTLLDIGCGGGFDGDARMQQELAQVAGAYLGIEPDPVIKLGAHFTEVHRCRFEDAPISPHSVDVAFAVMVLEHLTEPRVFWEKLGEILSPGGVFWGFTVDSRHWFCLASLWLKKLRVKDLYLHRLLRHDTGEEDYQNYPVYYRANSPAQVLPHVRPFGHCDFVSFARVGQMDYYLPRCLRGVSAGLDRSLLARGKPGAILALRLENSSPLKSSLSQFEMSKVVNV